MQSTASIPTRIDDPINAAILAVSEDKIQGFLPDPFAEIAGLSGIDLPTVIERIAAMLRAGTIRRVRQTLMSTNLATGALVAWQVPEEKLQSAFDWMFQQDPFSGHVVIRSTDANIPGAKFRLWTTLKVPQGYSLAKHCDFLLTQTGATAYQLLPAKKLFALGVGHVRRRTLEPGSKSDELGQITHTDPVELTSKEWRVLTELKREFTPEEIEASFDPKTHGDAVGALWHPRAQQADVPLLSFLTTAQSLNERKVIGRFSTFLEHVKPLKTGEQVTRYNALFHWRIPIGRELEAGQQIGRFHIMTHAYWREAGPEFNHVNLMGVAHGTDKNLLLAHKAAIDAHLEQSGFPVTYTNVFWGGRSEIKPSEISPIAYEEFCNSHDLPSEKMRE